MLWREVLEFREVLPRARVNGSDVEVSSNREYRVTAPRYRVVAAVSRYAQVRFPLVERKLVKIIDS